MKTEGIQGDVRTCMKFWDIRRLLASAIRSF